MTLQTLRVQKMEHLYLFRYAPGHEDDLVEEVMRLADDPEVDFDWMDATSVSFRVTQDATGPAGDVNSPHDAVFPEA